MKRYIKIYLAFIISFLFISITLPKLSYADVDSFSATLIDFEGDVFVQKEKKDEWLDVVINMPIQKEDNIITGEDSSAEIFIDDGSIVKVEESSEIYLKELVFDDDTDELEIEIFLKAGILLSNIVEAIHRSPSVRVYTNTAVAGVRGTEFVIDATDPNKTSIGVFSGEVDVIALDEYGNVLEEEPVYIREGFQTTILRNNPAIRPIILKEHMLLFKHRVNALRILAVQKRKNILGIIEKRRNVQRRIINLKKERIKRKRPPIRRLRRSRRR
jgi:hypothetical protein